jgi:GABA permease
MKLAPITAAPPLKRILVLANETAESSILREAVLQSSEEQGVTSVLVVAPALNSRLRHWLSDTDHARDLAQARLQHCVARLAAAGIEARGRSGDPDPLQALSDSLRCFAADQIIIATHPEGRSNWLARSLVERARESFPVPVLHVVLDAVEREEYVLEEAGARRVEYPLRNAA